MSVNLKSLYKISTECLSKLSPDSIQKYNIQHCLTDIMRIDLYYQIKTNLINSNNELIELQKFLSQEISNSDSFFPLLHLDSTHIVILHRIFQYLVNQECDFLELFSQNIVRKIHETSNQSEFSSSVYKNCLMASGFLIEAGWFLKSEIILEKILSQIRLNQSKYPDDLELRILLIDTIIQYFHCSTAIMDFNKAISVKKEMMDFLSSNISDKSRNVEIYNEFSINSYAYYDFSDAFNWSMKAISSLRRSTPCTIVIDVLIQLSKVLTIQRKYSNSIKTIFRAISLTEDIYGTESSKYADCLSVLGQYYLSNDNIPCAVEKYFESMQIRTKCYGGTNLKVALANEEFAYAHYVYVYVSDQERNFSKSLKYAESALKIANLILPRNHIFIGNAKKVLALILEELSINSFGSENDKDLQEAEKLHQDALQSCIHTFGENNLQTAKHFANLGRLYQTMKNYEKAEKLHKKAIEIKVSILGPEDHEVAISIGHLASLYTYDMKELDEAEKLYLRSIDISTKSYGPLFSGLEYDYIGLIQLYDSKQDLEKKFIYYTKLLDLRENRKKVLIDSSRNHIDNLSLEETSLSNLIASILKDETVKDMNSKTDF